MSKVKARLSLPFAFEFHLARRMLMARRSKMLTVVSLITMFGVAFGVMALLVTLAVVKGFEGEYERSLLAFNAHVVIMHPDGIENVDEVKQLIRKTGAPGELMGLTPFLYQEGLAVHQTQVKGVAIKVVDTTDYWRLSGLFHERRGDLTDGLWVGKALLEEMGPSIHSLRLRLPRPESSDHAFHSIPVVGFFSSGLYDYDANFALIDFQTAREKMGLTEKVDGVEVWLADPAQADVFSDNLREQLSFPYTILTWKDLNANLFGALKLEKLVFSIIMGLLILVASFNITGTLTMRILDKRGDIAVLRAMGARWSQIRRLFFCQGLVLGWMGCALGLAMGLIGLEFIKRFQPIQLAQEIYFIDFVPARWEMGHVFMVFAVTTIFSWLATHVALLRLRKLSVTQALGEI